MNFLLFELNTDFYSYCSHQAETSQLICMASNRDQSTGFHLIETLYINLCIPLKHWKIRREKFIIWNFEFKIFCSLTRVYLFIQVFHVVDFFNLIIEF